jgi:hypothetical protein
LGKTYLTIGDKNYRINLDNSTIKAKDLAAALGPAENLLYTKSADGTYAICAGFEDASEKEKENFIAIANTYEGVPVKSIGAGAFKDCKLTGIKIPNSVESIGDNAFKNCTGLTRVVFRDNLIDIAVVIGNKIFSLQNNFETTVTPNSLISIGNSAFYGCRGLTRIEIPDSVTTIGDSAFYTCYKLVEVVNKSKHITIEKDASSNGYLGYYALAVYNSDDTFATTKLSNDNGYTIYTNGNEKILVGYDGTETDLVLPSYVNKINQYAFYSCDSLTSIVIPNGVTSISTSAFYSCDSLTRVEIPNSVTSIGVSAFRNCYSLTSITIPDSVTSIGKYAFYCCNKFTSVIIPNSVTTIGDYAFASCYKLVSAAIGDSVTLIGKNAFASCYQLTSIVIGDSVESIDSYAFEYCYKLVEVVNKSTHITVAKGSTSNGYVGYYALAVYNSDSGITESQLTNNNGYLIYIDTNSNENILVNYCGTETDLFLPYYITKINKYALYNDNKLKQVTINSGVTSIGADAFASCDNLEYVSMSNTVTSVGTYVFSDCSSLTNVRISSSLTSINNYMFNNCDSLTTITIPNKVTNIGNYAFYDCDKLTELEIPSSVTSIGKNAFESCSALTSVKIPTSVESMGSDVFKYCNELTIKCDAIQAATNWDKNWNPSNIPVVWNGGEVLSATAIQSHAIKINPGTLKVQIPSNNYGSSPYSCWFQFIPPQSKQYSIEISSKASIECSLKSGSSSNSLSLVSSQTGTNFSLTWPVDSNKMKYIFVKPTQVSGATFTLKIS